MLKGESENNSRKLRDLLKNRQSDSLKKSQLTLSQRMLKKGDVNDDTDDDDDEVRTIRHRTVQQQH
jgi:hypothetical protein